MKNILIISSGQPSLNPRLVKEADLLTGKGYNVTVIYAYWNAWGTRLDDDLLPKKKWRAIKAGGDPVNSPIRYHLSRLLFKAATLFTKFTNSRLLLDIAITRSTYFLIHEAKKHQADIYIGHNIGALPAVVKAAKKYGKPCGFDAEDFHRNEVSDDTENYDVKIKAITEDRYLPYLTYFSASSRPIADMYKQLYPKLQPVVLKNVFLKSGYAENNLVSNIDRPLRLFWFSQVVGPKRGLENLITALTTISYPCELHLLGACKDEFKSSLTRYGITVHFHQPLPADEIITFSSQFDIGLALEPGFSVNNNLALSNKIFNYMQAGLALIVSNTKAQQKLLDEHPAIGKVFKRDDSSSLAAAITFYHQHRTALMAARKAALILAQTQLNWETEGEKLLKMIDNILAD